jgi:ABC-type branched-subunit amino acid transport system substrate-binding protein
MSVPPRCTAALCLAAVVLAACQSQRVAPVAQGARSGAAAGPTLAAPPPPKRTEVPAGYPAPTPPPATAVPPPPPKPHLTRVAMLLPLSGPNGELGNAMVDAAQLALFDFADERFELVFHDTQGTPDGAADAAALAIGDGAALILGPLLSTSVDAVAPAARAAGIAVVAYSSDRSVAGDGIFTMGFLPSAEVERVVSYARRRGLLRFAALAPDDDYGFAVTDALEGAVAAAAGHLERVELYDPYAEEFSNPVRRLADYDSRRAALLAQRADLERRDDEIARHALARLETLETIGDVPFDALILADGGKRLQAVAALLPFYDVDPAKVRVLGTGQWDEPGVGAEPALVGGWFAAPPRDARAAFERQYHEAYGVSPPRLATLAYDATALAAVLARAGEEPDLGVEALTVSSGFAGRDGIFRFRPDGVAERGLAVIEVLPRGFKLIDPAPQAFGPTIN